MERATAENEYRLDFKRKQAMDLTSQAQGRKRSLEEFRTQQLAIQNTYRKKAV